MHKRSASMLVLGTVLAVVGAGIADAYQPTILEIGDWEAVTINGGFKPTRLTKRKLAPIHLALEGRIATPDVLDELIVELDKNIAIDAKGLAICRPLEIVEPPTGVSKWNSKSISPKASHSS